VISTRILGEQTVLTPLLKQISELNLVEENPSLILLGATDAMTAARQLEQLPEDQRRRTIVVGLDDDLQSTPRAGTLGDLLERHQLLGAIPMATEAPIRRFLGPKGDHARLVQATYLRAESSRNYAGWIGLPPVDAGTFVSMLITALELDQKWFADGPELPFRDDAGTPS
jgi:hypothetical protein